MTDSNPRSYVHAEVLGGVQHRRRWTPEEKLRMVEETFLPDSFFVVSASSGNF
jgi:transposase